MNENKKTFDAKVIMKPPHVVFQNEFGSGEGRSSSSYSEYFNSKAGVFKNDKEYERIKSLFVALK